MCELYNVDSLHIDPIKNKAIENSHNSGVVASDVTVVNVIAEHGVLSSTSRSCRVTIVTRPECTYRTTVAPPHLFPRVS